MVDLSIFNIDSQNIVIRLITAIIILLIGFVIARILSNLTKKLLQELETNRILKEQAGVKIQVEEFIASLVKYLIYFIAVIMALNQLGLTTTRYIGRIYYIGIQRFYPKYCGRIYDPPERKNPTRG